VFLLLLALLPQNPAVVFLLLLWVDVEIVLGTVIFWSTANTVFNVRQAKRLFGFISLGFVISQFLGGLVIPFLIVLLPLNFLPLLMQVYFIPADVLVWPSVLHAVPGLTAAVATERFSERARQPINVVASNRFIAQRVAIG
jgi:AAA family ATP:ADP antiporter